jgi:formamidase
MQDLVAGTYEVPWETEVKHKDGAACGFEPPVREYAGPEETPAMPE